jgi:acyl-coenzyme A thioesterase PaaI-like protein
MNKSVSLVPHGGFITAMFLQVASAHFNGTLSAENQPHTIALHLDFLRRTQSGPALFTVKDTKLGRQTSVIHVTLTQNGHSSPREEVVGYITNSNLHTESGVSFHTEYALNPAPLPVNLSLLKQDKDENWGRQVEMPFASFRKATGKTQFHFPRQGQRKRGSADEWIRMVCIASIYPPAD